MEKSQFQTVKQKRQLTQSRQRWEQPNQAEHTALNHRTHFGKEKTAHGWLSLSGPTSVYGKIAVSNCKTGTPAHTGPATLGTTQHRQRRQHSTTELTLERRKLHTAGSAYPVLPVSMEKSQFQTVKQERQHTQGRQRWEEPNTGSADSTQQQNSLWRGGNCTRLVHLIWSYQCHWKNCSFTM